MKKVLKDILYGVAVHTVYGSTQTVVNHITFDSRNVKENTLFVAQRGTVVDGHKFIDKAIDLGSTTIICEQLPEKLIENITYVQVNNSNSALAIIASNFYDNPSRKIKLIGVTGTNGKTTVATLLYNLFRKSGYRVGLLSTVKIVVDETEYVATHTTPDSVSINHYLKSMVDARVEYCFMEVSSHGIHQKRTEGLQFAGGIFTNLSHDHLDYHNSFAEYRNVKKQFFDTLPKQAFALVNIDDKNGQFMLQNTKAKKVTYAQKTLADFKAKILESRFSGLLLNIDGSEVWVKLIGNFNAYNLLAIYSTAIILGLEKIEVLRLLSDLENVSGRFEYFISDGGITTIVDYAHTPDALKNVLETINSIRTGNEKLITVMGCGGDRDKRKRPKMGNIASMLSNQVIFTSDNPRTENPQTIIHDIEQGVAPENYSKTLSILDREQAIKTAGKFANSGDIVLIAGKGHETYQEINGQKSEFDDFKKAKSILKELQK